MGRAPDNPPGDRAGRPAIVVLHKGELLGDALVNIPAYRALRLAFPNHWIVDAVALQSQIGRSLKRIAPSLCDQILEHQPLEEGVARQRAMFRALRPIDAIVDFRQNFRAALSAIAATGLARSHVLGPLMIGAAGYRIEARAANNARRMHALVERLARRRLPFDPTLPELPAAAVQAARLLPSGSRYLGVAMGPRASFKAWRYDRHVAVARRAGELGLVPVFLLGPQESEEQANIRSDVPQAIVVGMDEAGGDEEYLLWLIHAVAGRLTLAYAVDGGIGHLIATRQGPLLTLMGPMSAVRWRPFTPHSRILDGRDFGARPASAIPADAVMATLAEMLRGVDGDGLGLDRENTR